MLTTRFGIEVELTGITRKQAAKTAAAFLGGRVESSGDYYDTQKVIAPDGRIWKFMSDGSIRTQKKENGRIVAAGREYSVELVSPILTYREDIETLQELIRRLRKAGGFANTSCGIHIHIDGADHTCGVRNRNMSRRYVEVLNYQYSAKYASFTTNGKDYRNKVLNDKIEVSIVLDLEWIDTPSDF